MSRERVRELTLSLLNQRQVEKLERDLEICTSMLDEEAGRVRVTGYYHAGMPELSARLCAVSIPDAEALGLPEVVAELARRPNGLVLITGPNGVGKTTTLNYMVDLINRERRSKIVMIEDPVEYVHRPVKSLIVQQEIHTDTVSFPRALVHVLRQNPDVIVIGEMRELDTIATAITAAETGHLVLATLHTPNVMQAIERITGVFPPTQQKQILIQLANSLQGIVAQDLLARVDRKGRILASEVLIATNAVRSIIREGHSHKLETAITTGRKHGMCTMDSSLIELYQKGIISYDSAVTRMRDPAAIHGGGGTALAGAG
jgi:twitching motility protein PilT